jgi:serine phosphatase RsbU (regulator of sigma subunit)
MMSELVPAVQLAKLLADTDELLGEDPRAAFTRTQDLLSHAETLSEPELVNKAKELLARCYQANGNYHKALETCLEVLPWYESQEDYAMAAKCLNTLGAAYNFMGEYENRLQTNLTCLTYRRKGGDEAGEISTLSNVGDSYNVLGNHDKALEYFNLCLAFSSITGRQKTIVIHNIGETEFFKGNFETAQEWFAQAVALARSTSYYIIEQVAFVFLAKIHLLNGNLSTATDCIDAAEKIAREKNYYAEIPPMIELRAKIAEQKGEFQKALSYYKEFIAMNDEIRRQNDTRAMQDMQFAYRVEKLQEENRQHKEKNREIRQAYLKIAQQHRVIEEKNRSITDSINYAFKIQSALLPSSWRFKAAFEDSFVFNQPRDIVSGDFWWLHENETHITLAFADCTGHGVPGALMSIVGIDCLNLVISDARATDPGTILSLLDHKIAAALNMGSGATNSADGMDIALLQVNKKLNEVSIASANRPVFHFSDEVLTEIKADKMPIGEFYDDEKRFTTRVINVKKGDVLYFFTDGYPDQFGGDRGKKLKLKGFRNFVQSIAALPLSGQEQKVAAYFHEWKGDHEQVDDVLVGAIRF